MYYFQKAKAVWRNYLEEKYNQFVGFHTHISVETPRTAMIAVTARSYYRLYVNGVMVSCGPARSAEHFCRVDEIEIFLEPESDLAIEVAAYSKTEKYCNDCTMEPGLLIAEVTDSSGNVLSATGITGWTCQELTYRRAFVETMSHCRGILEYYDLSPDSFEWRQKYLQEQPVVMNEEVSYLRRRAPFASYRSIPFHTMQMIYDLQHTEAEVHDTNIMLARLTNPKWYELIPEENFFLETLAKEIEVPFTGNFKFLKSKEQNRQKIQVSPGHCPTAILWEMPESEVGFLDFQITVNATSIIDVLHSDHLQTSGRLKSNTYATRYCLQPGTYHLTTFEPKLVRYIKFIIRTGSTAELLSPVLIEDSYPDERSTFFQCNDGDLNRIYEAARRTLRLNTLDIFMDCPERERGGWLCDSYFIAKGAWQLFGDLSVEKDFLENFMLTDPNQTWKGFFPEVYPAVRGENGDVGLRNWSFWLLLELCDYYERSGDYDFINQCRQRVEHFVGGVLTLRGQSGLLENMGPLFVDWSLSNSSFSLEPVSVPINCLAVCMLEQLADLYGREDWKMKADEMRVIIENLDSGGLFDRKGDSLQVEVLGSGAEEIRLKRCECQTEGGIALEIWSGFHTEDKIYLQEFMYTMGSFPQYRANPNIVKSNLFVGLMIRFDVLARLGKAELLIREWKDLYLEELKIGPGTLFEAINERAGCHGFNGYIGTLIMNMILGLGQPHQRTKTVKISPHPGELTWAGGSVRCADGTIFLRWSADYEAHVFDMMLYLPDGWRAVYEMPFELVGWTIKVNGEAQKFDKIKSKE